MSVFRTGLGSVGGPGLPQEPSEAPEAAQLESSRFQGDRKLAQVFQGDAQLTQGSRGASLRKVQKGLQQIGLPLYQHGADGRWHDELRSAVVQFQQQNGLEASGMVDGQTLQTLDKLLKEADGALSEAGADGQITVPELEQAEKDIAAKVGPERAKDVLRAALGQDPKKVDFKAIDYLQGNIGSMKGHVARYQQVLAGHLKGAKLLDANFDGRFDKDDLIFTENAAGEIDVKKAGQALCDQVRIGGAMVDAAYEMGEKKHRFGNLEFNAYVWEHEDPDALDDPDYKGMSTMVQTFNGDVTPAMALRDIFTNPDSYQFECATAITIIRYKALLELLGDNDFNRIMGDTLRIGAWEADDITTAAWKIEGPAAQGEEVEADDAAREKMRPGDYSYFRNWDVSEEGMAGGWQGENVISLGDGLYFGHPFGITSGEDIIKHLNGAREKDSNVTASLLDVRARIGAQILEHDQDPYG